MPTHNPRINVVLEGPLYRAVKKWAGKEGVSLSTKVRDIIRDALEFGEDLYLAKIAEQREKTFDRRKALTHKQVFSK